MVVHLTSPDSRYDMTYLRNYAVLNVKDRLARLQGVGEVGLFGSGDYAMRVWLDPQKVAQRNLTATEIVNAIREQNIQVAAGTIGASPSNSPLQLSVNAQGRLTTEQEFADIILKTAPDGAVTRLGDVARVELAASQYGLRSLLDNKQAVAIPIFQAPGANALQVSDQVRSTMKELSKDFPSSIKYDIVYDPTQFVRASIKAVVHTLLGSNCAGCCGCYFILANMACFNHSIACCTGFNYWYIRAHACFWLLDQRAFSVRDGTCHRDCGR